MINEQQKITESEFAQGEIIDLQKTGTLVYVDPDVMTTLPDGTELSFGPPNTLPKGIPTDVPVYPGDLSLLSWALTKSPGSSIITYSVTIITPTDKATVLDWYTAELKSDGWKIGSVNTAPDYAAYDGVLIDATNDTNKLSILIYNIGDSPTKRQISLTISALTGN
jgi:hypothetical protein